MRRKRHPCEVLGGRLSCAGENCASGKFPCCNKLGVFKGQKEISAFEHCEDENGGR